MQEQVLFFKCKRTLLQCLNSSAVSLNMSDPTDSSRSKEFWYRRSKVYLNKKEGGDVQRVYEQAIHLMGREVKLT